MTEVQIQKITHYDMVGLTADEFDILRAALAVAPTTKVRAQLGINLSAARINEMLTQLWEDTQI